MPSLRSRLVSAKLPSRFLEKLHVRQSGCLMHDRVGLGLEDGLAHRASVEQIEHDRLRAERPQTLDVARRPGGADHVMPSIDQLRNEPGADRTARPCNENSHRVSPLIGHISGISRVYFYDPTRRRNVTDG